MILIGLAEPRIDLVDEIDGLTENGARKFPAV
jgi:hypothetical protein